MVKNFDQWNEKKKDIHTGGTAPLFHEREIWFCSLGVNIGFEQDGTGQSFDRPVVILRGFNKNTFLGVGVTGRKKEGFFYYYLGNITGRDASANLSQIRLIDSKRLVKKIGTVDKETFNELKRRLQEILMGEEK